MWVRNSAVVLGQVSLDVSGGSKSESELELSLGVLKSGSDAKDDDDVVEFAGDRPARLFSVA